jgi:hypothetical protein
MSEVAAKIVKLLLKAESTEHEGERNLLLAKAQELQVRYQVDSAQLARLRDQGQPERMVERFVVTGARGAGVNGRRHLAANICASLPVRGFSSKGRFVIFGYESDVELACMLYSALLVQAEAALVHASKRRPQWTAPTTFRANFLIAYAERVGARLAQQASEAQASVQAEIDAQWHAQRELERAARPACVELIVLERAEQVEAEVAKRYRLRTQKFNTTYCGSARAAGNRAGSRADITPQNAKLANRKLLGA